MHSRAAWRLESLGFPEVYRYAPGKVDWVAAGLPTEGPGAKALRAGAVARRDVPTGALTDPAATAAGRALAAGWDACVVVNDHGIVMGRLRAEDVAGGDPGAPAAEAMRPGPTTVRASEPLGELAERLHRRRVTDVLVTDPDGGLIGLLLRDDADAALAREGGGPGRAP